MFERFRGQPGPFHAIRSRVRRSAHPVRVLVAAVVLGVMNQACAVNGAGRQPVHPVRAAQTGKPVPAKKAAPTQAPTATRGIQLRPSTESAALSPPVTAQAVLAGPAEGASPAPVGGTNPQQPLAVAPKPLAEPTLASHAVTLSSPPAIASTRSVRPTPPAAPKGVPPVPPAATMARASHRPGTAARQAPVVAGARPATAVAERVGASPAAAGVSTLTASALGRAGALLAPASESDPAMAVGVTRQTTTPIAAFPTDDESAAEAETDKFDSLWARVRSGFGVPDLQSPLVDRHEAFYANRPEYLQRIVERGKRYLHFIVEEVEKRGMPLEIALLPVIESAYNPKAYSKAHASGMWQFIPSTGKTYGLEQNWWYDGRRDVLAATRAALDYLQKLHADFGDWQLALAAYNWGEGAVARAIERNQRRGLPTDYINLTMPAETRNYLPKLQAVKNIVSEPERFGMALDDVPNEPYFIRVAAPGHIDFKRAAQLAEVPLEELHSLNPAHNRPVIATDQSLLIPADKADVFEQNLRTVEGPLTSWRTYHLPAAERIDAIAARFHTSVALLAQVNDIRPGTRLKAGSSLLVPADTVRGSARMSEVTRIDTSGFTPPQVLTERRSHKVRKGETLAAIAERYGVALNDLMAWNRLSRPLVRPGTTLRLQAPTKNARGARSTQRSARPAKTQAKPANRAKTKRSGSASAARKPVAHAGAKASRAKAAKKLPARK